MNDCHIWNTWCDKTLKMSNISDRKTGTSCDTHRWYLHKILTCNLDDKTANLFEIIVIES